ncbi:MAG: type I 3-dehydroquinate dehydratase [Phycisphaerales bacterium]
MNLLCVPIAVDAPDMVGLALERARLAASRGANLLEWRVDALAEDPQASNAIRRLVREAPLPTIVTIRAASEGGLYDGDDTDRVSLIEAIATSGDAPRYLDFEWASYSRSANLAQKIDLAVEHPGQVRPVETRLILSLHDLEGRPRDLLQQIAAMAHAPACALVKVAWRARSIRDNLEMFDLLAERPRPMAAMGLGPFGLMSRVLSPKFGGFMSYAALDADLATAEGQPTIEEMLETYRYRSIGPATEVYGVIGWPVGHSKSPAFHNAAFAARGRDAVLVPMPIAPGWEPFKASIGSMLDHPRLGFRGAAVTIPHKEHLVRFVEERGGEIEPLAARIGAANTLLMRRDGSLVAANTDAPAAAEAMAEGFGLEPDALDASSFAGRRIAVLGAGGAAAAGAAGRAQHGATVVLANRTKERAEVLADRLRAAGDGRWRLSAAGLDSLACGCFHGFVNATPVGMEGGPEPDGSPLPDDVALDDSIVVFDTVYAPERTPLLAEAASRGAKVVGGMSMFTRQAERQQSMFAAEG